MGPIWKAKGNLLYIDISSMTFMICRRKIASPTKLTVAVEKIMRKICVRYMIGS